MNAYLREKNGYFHMVFPYQDADGKWHKKSESTKLKVKGNKRRAEAMLAARLEELGHCPASTLENSKLLFLDAMSDWLDNVMVSQVRPNTLEQYQNAFAYNIKTYVPFQGLRLQKLTAKILQDFYNSKVKSGLSACTIRKFHANINKFLKFAVSMDMIPFNPAERVTLPKKERSEVGKAYTAQQVQELLSLFRGDALELVVFLTVTYGLRRSEVCGIRWQDVDFENRHIFIRHTAIVCNGKVTYTDRTKSAMSRRTLPMSDQVYTRLQQALIEQEQRKQDYGNSWPDTGYLCIRPDGIPYDPTFVSHHFARVIKKSNLPYIRFHDLRHTVATLLHNGGFDMKDIQGWLGHSDFSTTANIYSHLDQSRFDGMAQAMEKHLL